MLRLFILFSIWVLVPFLCVQSQELPMVYEYFNSSEGPGTGLVAEADGFKLNGKPIKILSGAIHYFRVHPDYWRDRLRKLRALGANTVETYVAWNIHEPEMNQFDFGSGGNEWSAFAGIRKYVQMAKEEDLLVLFRPGPYICTEWEFGGFPSWLQRDPDMKVRTSYPGYLERSKIYFDQLLPQVVDLQFTRGGSIIGVQLENEYGFFNNVDSEYLEFLYRIYEEHGFVNETLMFTSDGPFAEYRGTLPDKLLMTANFGGDADRNFGKLKELQPDKPLMTMEFYPGWFDHWFEIHHTTTPGTFMKYLDDIVGPKWDGSVNFYMFHGGTNFGFMNGANSAGDPPYYLPDTTSYDYDAPLSEAGDYSVKYHLAKTLFEYYQVPKIRQTQLPLESLKEAYPTIKLDRYLTYDDILDKLPASNKFRFDRANVTMEKLEMNNGNGQSYGYIVYRKEVDISNGTQFEAGPVKDFGMILIDSQVQEIGQRDGNYWMNSVESHSLNVRVDGPHTLDLMIENMGRINFGNDVDFLQQKGLGEGSVFKLNDQELSDIEVFALEFKSSWVTSLSGWKEVNEGATLEGPVLVQADFNIQFDPADTFIDMSAWHKGIVFVNGFNLGRYWKVGPQQTLYVPAPVLRQGSNTITIFEQFEPATEIVFRAEPNLGPEEVATENSRMCMVKS